MACIGRNYLSIFKLIKYMIVVFDEVYIVFHFNIILYLTQGDILYKKKRISYHDNTSMTRGCRNPAWYPC